MSDFADGFFWGCWTGVFAMLAVLLLADWAGAL